MSKLPRHYLEWLKSKQPPIYGPLELAVYKALGLPAPIQPPPESVEEIQNRVIREVFARFEARDREGRCDCGGPECSE